MEDGIELGSWKALLSLAFWPEEVGVTITTSDDGSVLGGRDISVPSLGGLHVVVVRRGWSLATKPENSLPNHMYVVG